MSSSIYQGLQSCLEPRLLEPRVLRLKLTPSISNSPWLPAAMEQNSDLSAIHSDSQLETHLEIGEIDVDSAGDGLEVDGTAANGGGNGGGGGWSFLQALSGVYAHPPAMPALSEKSLEMCTESLGSETGSDGSEIGGDEKMSLFSSDEIEMSPSFVSERNLSRFSRLRARKFAEPR